MTTTLDLFPDDPERNHFPPTLGRLYRVSCGASQWSPQEIEWINGNPQTLDAQAELAGAIRQVEDRVRSIENTFGISPRDISQRFGRGDASRN